MPPLRRASAQQMINRLWRKAAPAYGMQGMPPPRLKAVKKGGGYAYTMGTDTPQGWVPSSNTIYGNPNFRRALRSTKKSAYNAAKFTALHEMGHLYGPNGAGPTGNEGEANRAANIALRRMNRRGRRR